MLRKWNLIGAAGPGATGVIASAAQRAAMAEASAEEAALVRLTAATPPSLLGLVSAEVERRAAVFDRVRRETRRTPVVWPRRAALESVYADLVQGRL